MRFLHNELVSRSVGNLGSELGSMEELLIVLRQTNMAPDRGPLKEDSIYNS